MAETGAFRSSTFKPTIDKWIARDGVPVVLWSDDVELLVLHYKDREWTIATHGFAGLDDPAGTCYRGDRYEAEGTVLFRLTESASDAEWTAAYEEYFERQKQRLQLRLADPAAPTGPLAAV